MRQAILALTVCGGFTALGQGTVDDRVVMLCYRR